MLVARSVSVVESRDGEFGVECWQRLRGDMDVETACSRRVSERLTRKTHRDAGQVSLLPHSHLAMAWLCNRERKCAENYNKWHNKNFFLNCSQHFGNFKPWQFASAVWYFAVCFYIYFIWKIYQYFSTVPVVSGYFRSLWLACWTRDSHIAGLIPSHSSFT